MTQDTSSQPEPQLWYGDSNTLDMPSDEDREYFSDSETPEEPRRAPRL
jgi:hypothetical protein